MGFACGIVGLPNVGKSTLFNALTAAGAASANYPFCTIEPNIGRVDVPDPRLQILDKYVKAQRIVPASMSYVDIAGLVKGASRGEGLGNKFLGHIRETEAIAHVVRCFIDSDITHVDGDVNPIRDIETIDTELILCDSETVERSLSRLQKLSKSQGAAGQGNLTLLSDLAAHLQALKPARSFQYEKTELNLAAIYELHLLTAKPVVYVCNVSEDLALGNEDNEFTKAVCERAATEGAEVIRICAKIEEELADLDPESRQEMISDLGMAEPGLNRLIRAGYSLLGLQTYFTAGEKEIRAWTIQVNDKAPVAAGKIHSDFERGFICAEVYRIPDLEKVGSRPKLKEQGLLRTEGREYVVRDGDVIEFRFNV